MVFKNWCLWTFSVQHVIFDPLSFCNRVWTITALYKHVFCQAWASLCYVSLQSLAWSYDSKPFTCSLTSSRRFQMKNGLYEKWTGASGSTRNAHCSVMISCWRTEYYSNLFLFWWWNPKAAEFELVKLCHAVLQK